MRSLRISFCTLAAVLLTAGTACAAGDAHGNDWGNLAWRLLNLAIVVGIIWKLAGAKIASFLSGRRDGIARELDDIETRKEKARQELMDVEKRIANLENERKAILADYEARGEALKAEIVAKAEETAGQIMTQARQTARNEVDNALAAMREELADKIVDAAGKSIAGSLSGKDQEKLLNNFLDKVVLQ